MRVMDTIRWFFALPDPAVDRSKMSPMDLWLEAHQCELRTPYGRVMRRYRALHYTIPRRSSALLAMAWNATLGRWLWIKRSHFAETEMATMRFVAQHTDIPVPRVWFSFRWGAFDHIVMDRIKGITLFEALELGYIQEGSDKEDLRSLAPPPNSTSICSVIKGPVKCFRLFSDPKFGPVVPAPPVGPFETEETMNLQIRHLRVLESCDPIVIAAHSKTHALVLTHNDLAPRNIMVDHSACKILAIIDWECAGWFPAHWEICKMINWEKESVTLGWRRWVSKVFPGAEETYRQELEADALLLKQFWVPEHGGRGPELWELHEWAALEERQSRDIY
ncbi:kinase-like domain-containing protein [Mycena sanguinolenta]|nr:kinase-like domain-containing protein [Mycena sanguinolenta]